MQTKDAGAGTMDPDGDAGRRPRVLASTGSLLLSPLAWVLGVFADAGYSGAEVLIAHNPETRDAQRVLAYAQHAGLDVPVVHGPYMVLLRRVLGSDYIRKSRRSLELTAALGADLMVAHAPFRWERAARAWLGQADAEAEALGVRFGMENLFPYRGRALSCCITPEQLAGYRHVVFDTSHFGVAGVDLFEAWDRLRERVVHLHVSDNAGQGRDTHGAIGSGTLPLAEFLTQVGRSGFAGTVTLELDCRAHLESRDRLVGFLAGQRQAVERLLAGDPQALERYSVPVT